MCMSVREGDGESVGKVANKTSRQNILSDCTRLVGVLVLKWGEQFGML